MDRFMLVISKTSTELNLLAKTEKLNYQLLGLQVSFLKYWYIVPVFAWIYFASIRIVIYKG